MVGQIVGSSTVEQVIGYFFLRIGTGGIRAVAGSYFWGFAEKGAEMFDKKYYRTFMGYNLDNADIPT